MKQGSWLREIIHDLHNRSGRRVLRIAPLAFILLAPGNGYGRTIGDTGADLRLPERFGEVVYQEHRDPDNRVYVIAQSHRSVLSGKETDDCQQVQAQIYRIGEWLIANENVEAILPEGYFSDDQSGTAPQEVRPREETRQSVQIDDAALADLLSNPASFNSADRLLYDAYDLALRQIEDRSLYFTVVDQLRSLLSSSSRQQDDPTVLPILLYQQKKRSAVILENLPKALTAENSAQGESARIRRAILTIGLSHVDTMIDLLKKGKTQILPPAGLEDRVKGYTCDLNGVKKSYTIYFIVPQTLKKSREKLRLRNSPASSRQEKGNCAQGKT